MECPICLNELCESEQYITTCAHKFHQTCFFQIPVRENSYRPCPLCRCQIPTLVVTSMQPPPQIPNNSDFLYYINATIGVIGVGIHAYNNYNTRQVRNEPNNMLTMISDMEEWSRTPTGRSIVNNLSL